MYARSGGSNPVILTLGRGLSWFNQRHPWSHNDHFHGWIMARLPARRRTALEVGCGDGRLVVGLAKHPLPGGPAPHPAGMPMAAPTESVDEIAAVAHRVLPGAVVRRRLFFRYTLEWTRLD